MNKKCRDNKSEYCYFLSIYHFFLSLEWKLDVSKCNKMKENPECEMDKYRNIKFTKHESNRLIVYI